MTSHMDQHVGAMTRKEVWRCDGEQRQRETERSAIGRQKLGGKNESKVPENEAAMDYVLVSGV